MSTTIKNNNLDNNPESTTRQNDESCYISNNQPSIVVKNINMYNNYEKDGAIKSGFGSMVKDSRDRTISKIETEHLQNDISQTMSGRST